MSKADKNEQIDADILQCKADILRAHDIIPPYTKKPRQEPKSQKAGENTTGSADEGEISAEEEKTAGRDIQIPKPEKTSDDNDAESKADLKETEAAEKKTAFAKKATEKKPREDTSPIRIETISAKETAPPTKKVNRKETVKMALEQGEIPRFDLAEEIMAEQRKITAIKRKAPGRKIETQIGAQKAELEVEPIGYNIAQPAPAPLEQEQIVAEIVARDIERLCRGD